MMYLWIVGNGIHAGVLWEYLSSDVLLMKDHQICGFIADEEYIQDEQFKGLPVKTFEGFGENERKDVLLLLGIGYSHMADFREKLYHRCKKNGFAFLNYIHPTAVIHPSVRMGEGNVILENVIIEAGCEIGSGNMFYGGSVLGHDTFMGDYNTMSIGAVTAGCVKINNHCFLGVRAVIRDHVTLSNYALVGAAAYAYKDVPAYHVVYSPRCEMSGEKKSVDLI
ncbi:sugar O-acyltransferase, sialic acid O-acetyltransferase NeuD family [Ruminococcus flavefaciens]|uniref:Sugar O-acyltransferase, sialic acid O-acetyltransferase NeuD family n=1 Tax=Ruminococcus flavefaciens TaxID=1265 RepID=A0A1H6JZ43_RUMFL|nr:acetyltransferase [Ruminococcus flavefaciens]SEH64673.1 sugar O-acyltransferase, sialic acid O-acetyltransferase NeuD family [Ruminococcus flavefaciens]